MQEGVEMVERNRWNRSVIAQQKKLVRYSVRDILVTKEMVEYTDFLLQSAMGNAAEFIFCAIEQGLDLISKRGKTMWTILQIAVAKGVQLSHRTVERAIDDQIRAELITKERCWRENSGRSSLLFFI